jgi:hypothetical protein
MASVSVRKRNVNCFLPARPQQCELGAGVEKKDLVLCRFLDHELSEEWMVKLLNEI